MMVSFPPEQLDLGRLVSNLATRKLELIQYEAIVAGLEPGDERDAWTGEVARVEAEVVELNELIAAKKEYNRGNA